jgi:hypothetical protein
LFQINGGSKPFLPKRFRAASLVIAYVLRGSEEFVATTWPPKKALGGFNESWEVSLRKKKE